MLYTKEGLILKIENDVHRLRENNKNQTVILSVRIGKQVLNSIVQEFEKKDVSIEYRVCPRGWYDITVII